MNRFGHYRDPIQSLPCEANHYGQDSTFDFDAWIAYESYEHAIKAVEKKEAKRLKDNANARRKHQANSKQAEESARKKVVKTPKSHGKEKGQSKVRVRAKAGNIAPRSLKAMERVENEDMTVCGK